MARPLIVLAVGGLALSAICLSLAGSLAADEISIFTLPFGERFGWRSFFGERCTETSNIDSTATSREFAWDGDDSVAINIPAEVHYQPGPSRSVSVTGTPEILRHVLVEDGDIAFDCSWRGRGGGKLDVTLPGSAMRSFVINGSGHLFLNGIDQNELKIAVHGSGDVQGSGRADRLDLSIAGSGDVDLSRLSTKRLRAIIAGSGDADVAPQDDADIVIIGSGDVRLHTEPKHLSSKVVGSGRIVSSLERPI